MKKDIKKLIKKLPDWSLLWPEISSHAQKIENNFLTYKVLDYICDNKDIDYESLYDIEGVENIELNAAYACIANGGTYIKPNETVKIVSDDFSVLFYDYTE